MTREQVALQPPAGRDLTGFPVTTIGAALDLYRAHRQTLGPWYFSSSGAGRFDLSGSRGTCYLALDLATAVREVVGSTLHDRGVVPAAIASDRAVSRLRLPTSRDVADLCTENAANFGITREIHTLVPYDVPRAWAHALDTVTGGVLYESRFTTTVGANAVAVFDTAGPAAWPTDRAPQPFASAARAIGLAVATTPHSATFTQPPN